MMDQVDFNQLVELAMRESRLAAMRPVVEKEILHYDIFQALDSAGLLKDLVFQGGTSLRLCRGADRFSEDLDFAGGTDFTAASMHRIKECIEAHLGKRYYLKISVKEPTGESGDIENIKVDKWVISVETSPGRPDIPRQRIKLEIANIPAYTRELVPLVLNYDFLAGMPEVLVVTESISEVLADKVVAFPTSLADMSGAAVASGSRKIRHRDIWDLAWLTRKRAVLMPELVIKKVADYRIDNYAALLDNAIVALPSVVHDPAFMGQMQRFIDQDTLAKTLARSDYLDYLATTVGGLLSDMRDYLKQANAGRRTAP
ncbi:nucleotidyl transferase AbiEii/AbiGii toxin family protein [Lacisediminimonas sp.]|uniref:nucleotidyl transferase AbiEii/AbiGii toxin family protein n=1 Tax=Lacisediminimonas sp. TaxID=3060582 RepID=UPI002725F0A5|nr:nucleotidyl transferase AbiEii/AbiGii toxin family protein [Lacisediminimonas sp.]MDO8298940.1 nucleotidyl transferase AbiEii/AbiGii toxin family protein [Lacisediminimonas sp.]